jgi:hypothetical protein
MNRSRFGVLVLLLLVAALPAVADELVNQPASATYPAYAYADQDFQASSDGFDCFAADDFTVPADTTWTIEEIFFGGLGYNGFTSMDNVDSVNCAIFDDEAPGVPGGAPLGYGNDPLWSESWAIPNVSVTDNSFTATLTTPQVLSADTYWLSCWVAMDQTVGGQWGALISDTANGGQSQWINPLNGFGLGGEWIDLTVLGAPTLDLAFVLYGTALTAPTVDSIDPASGTNDGPVDVTITGTGFVDGDTAVGISTGEGKAEIVATDIVVTDETTLNCTFDLTGAAAGAYDVAVTTSAGTGTLPGGFTVEEATDDDTSDDDSGDDTSDDDSGDDDSGDDDSGDDDDDSSGGCGC